jgi:hypothetical protein
MNSSSGANAANSAIAAARARLAQVDGPSNSRAGPVVSRNPDIQALPTASSLTEQPMSSDELLTRLGLLRIGALSQLANQHQPVSRPEQPAVPVRPDDHAPQPMAAQQGGHAQQVQPQLLNWNGLQQRPGETFRDYQIRHDQHLERRERVTGPVSFCKFVAKGLCCCCYVVVVGMNGGS